MVEIFNITASEVDTTTLAAAQSMLIAGLFATLQRNFMLKNLKSIVHVSYPNLGDSCLLVLASADASAAEINSAMSSTSKDLEDGQAYPNGQQEVRLVWDIQAIPLDGMVAGGSSQFMIQWKLPPKGIPLLKGRGLTIHAFNFDVAVAFSNGPSFKSYSKAQGGWF